MASLASSLRHRPRAPAAPQAAGRARCVTRRATHDGASRCGAAGEAARAARERGARCTTCSRACCVGRAPADRRSSARRATARAARRCRRPRGRVRAPLCAPVQVLHPECSLLLRRAATADGPPAEVIAGVVAYFCLWHDDGRRYGTSTRSRPIAAECARGRFRTSVVTVYAQKSKTHDARSEVYSNRYRHNASQLLPLHHLRSWSCNLSQSLSAVFLYSSIKSDMALFELFGAQILVLHGTN